MINLQDIQLNQVSNIYMGKDRVCRCGCAGNYIATSFMIDPRSEVNDVKAQARLNKAKKLTRNTTTEVEYGDTYINVSYGNNRAITIYLDEVKQS